MKRIIIITLISGLTGCQDAPSLTAKNFSELSSENLCRALGTYNHDGESVLKIYDEFKKRPDKINPERCHALEKIEVKQQHKTNENDIKTNTPYTDDIKPKPLHANKMKANTLYINEIKRNSSHTDSITINSLHSNHNIYKYTDPQHHKIIHKPRDNNKIDKNKNKKMDYDDFKKMTSLNNMPAYRNGPYIGEEFIFSSKEMMNDKIDMKEDDLSELMRECLKKHLSKHHVNAEK